MSDTPPSRINIKTQRSGTPPDNDWEKRLSPEEASWCLRQIELYCEGLYCVDSIRAAKIWKSSQMRRFRRIESSGCCGSTNFVAKRWNDRHSRQDIYLLGFNHSH